MATLLSPDSSNRLPIIYAYQYNKIKLLRQGAPHEKKLIDRYLDIDYIL
jgi:hypothetical protein